MGRRKVDPSKRQRAVKACWQCKRSKKKCDASLPCSNCVKRGTPGQCSFPDEHTTPSTGQIRASVTSSSIFQQHGNAADDAGSASGCSDGVPLTPLSPSDSRQTARRTVSVDEAVEQQGSGEAHHRTRARFLSNAQGTKVYIGSSALLAFLQLVRDAVSQSIGDSDFTNSARRNQMLEASPSIPTGIETQEEVDASSRIGYTHYFVAGTKGIVDFFTKAEVNSVVESVIGADDVKSSRVALACLVIAIGAQCSPIDGVTWNHEKIYFARAQEAAFADMLSDPSLEMIQVFLLMTFYMLGACQRNTAFMYLGVAARAAYSLGLHKPELLRVLSEEERKSRVVIWKSLVNLDLIVSSILGREPATSTSLGEDQFPPSTNDLNPGEYEALQASYEMSILINSIGNKLYGSPVVTTQAAEVYLERLHNWSRRLPIGLRLSRIPQSERSSAREMIMGSLHVSCYYHFAVMLVCRPFLIAHLTQKLARHRSNPHKGAAEKSLENNEEVTDLAQTCLTAAIYMAQTATEVLETNYMLDSMCILKAWIFAAGLVLGFRMFATIEQDSEIEEAFSQTRIVLQKLSITSQQAAHYLGILEHLANAVTKQRQLSASRKRRRVGPIVDRIFTLRPMEESPELSLDSYQTHHEQSEGLAYDISSPAAFLETQSDFLNSIGDVDQSTFGWGNSAFQSWDKFAFDEPAFDITNLLPS